MALLIEPKQYARFTVDKHRLAVAGEGPPEGALVRMDGLEIGRFARDHEIASGESLAAQEIVARADQGDAMASETLARYEERLARALATVIRAAVSASGAGNTSADSQPA